MKKSRDKQECINLVQTLPELLYTLSSVYVDLPAVQMNTKDDVRVISFHQLWIDVCNVGKIMHDKKWKGKNVALIGTLDYEWIVAFLAIVSSGNIAVPIDKQTNGINELLHMAEVIGLYIDSSVKNMDTFESEIKEKCIFSNNSEIKNSINIMDYCGRKTSNGLNCVNKEDSAIIIFTSGTTGKSKGVVLTHESIISNVKCGRYFVEGMLEEGDTTIPVLPPTHMFEITAGMLIPLSFGTSLCFGGSMKYISNHIKKFKPKLMVLVPMIIENMYDKVMIQVKKKVTEKKLKRIITISNTLRRVGIDLRKVLFKEIRTSFGGNMDFIISGGAALNEEIIKAFDDFGIGVYEGYGITECSPIISCNRMKQRKMGAVGVKGPDEFCEVQIIHDEVCVKGSIVFKGYYNDETLTREFLKDGWFHTGDLGKIDEDGFIFITGRKKNLIILSDGNNVSPEEIEKYFANCQWIQSLFVNEKSVDGKKYIAASVYPNYELREENPNLDLEQLIRDTVKEVNLKLPPYKRIQKIDFYAEDFEKTALGKIRRFKYKGE